MRLAGWPAVYRPYGSAFPPVPEQKTISDLLSEYSKLPKPDQAAETLYSNLGYANPASAKPIRKAELVRQIAELLVSHGVERFNDYFAYPSAEDLDTSLRTLPSMSSGVITSYLRMLAGSEENTKPDRMLHRYIRHASGESALSLSNEQVTSLIRNAAEKLAMLEGLSHITPRLLDHEVWKVQRNRETPAGSNKAKILSTGYRHRGPSPAEPVSNSPVIRERIAIDEFWAFCMKGGHTPSGLAFGVDAENRLHIRSPRAANQNYRISRETVASYLEKARDAKFRQNHGWFSRVYDLAITTPRETGSPAIIGCKS